MLAGGEMSIQLTEHDIRCFSRAVELARIAETEGNLPIGAVISSEGEIIAEGRNAIWQPVFNPNRHAEIEALRAVPARSWLYPQRLTLYTTLEPCLMCLGAILLHRVGRVLFGAADSYGGAGPSTNELPPYFSRRWGELQWVGPAYPYVCDELYQRVMRFVERQEGDG
jgi:tRNA(adenine34) deaminase